MGNAEESAWPAALVVQMEAAGHERARCVERTVRIQYGNHAVALDGEGQTAGTE